MNHDALHPTTPRFFALSPLMALITTFMVPPAPADADDSLVHFDLPPIAEARVIDPTDPTLVIVQLPLSSMIESTTVPTIDQWIVRCQPRDLDISIVDYAPRTETSSDLLSPIQVKETEEETNGFGLSVDGAYGHAVRGNLGSDRAKKSSQSIQFDRVAPEQIVTASGTINRGRGVYFKLRWTAQQVLEGEKVFRLTLRVPARWRGSLIDVSVVAQSEQKSFGVWDRDARVFGAANFVVATHRDSDQEAARHARALSEAELTLHRRAAHYRDADGKSLPSMLRHVAIKLDLEPSSGQRDWLQRLLLGDADPYLDDTIKKLPMPLRVAVLDYADVRDEFGKINRKSQSSMFAAKPALE